MAKPSGTPTTTATPTDASTCQPTMRRAWRRVRPSTWSTATSRRRRLVVATSTDRRGDRSEHAGEPGQQPRQRRRSGRGRAWHLAEAGPFEDRPATPRRARRRSSDRAARSDERVELDRVPAASSASTCAGGDRAHPRCSWCGRPRREHLADDVQRRAVRRARRRRRRRRRGGASRPGRGRSRRVASGSRPRSATAPSEPLRSSTANSDTGLAVDVGHDVDDPRAPRRRDRRPATLRRGRSADRPARRRSTPESNDWPLSDGSRRRRGRSPAPNVSAPTTASDAERQAPPSPPGCRRRARPATARRAADRHGQRLVRRSSGAPPATGAPARRPALDRGGPRAARRARRARRSPSPRRQAGEVGMASRATARSRGPGRSGSAPDSSVATTDGAERADAGGERRAVPRRASPRCDG